MDYMVNIALAESAVFLQWDSVKCMPNIVNHDYCDGSKTTILRCIRNYEQRSHSRDANRERFKILYNIIYDSCVFDKLYGLAKAIILEDDMHRKYILENRGAPADPTCAILINLCSLHQAIRKIPIYHDSYFYSSLTINDKTGYAYKYDRILLAASALVATGWIAFVLMRHRR